VQLHRTGDMPRIVLGDKVDLLMGGGFSMRVRVFIEGAVACSRWSLSVGEMSGFRGLLRLRAGQGCGGFSLCGVVGSSVCLDSSLGRRAGYPGWFSDWPVLLGVGAVLLSSLRKRRGGTGMAPWPGVDDRVFFRWEGCVRIKCLSGSD